MNLINSKCTSCGDAILVNQQEISDVFAHICTTCYQVYNDMNGVPAFYSPDGKSTEVYSEVDSDWDGVFTDEEIVDNDFDFINNQDRKCECGGTKTGVPHSYYCPLYNKD